MPTLAPIRNVPERIMEALDKRASEHGQSRESYIRGIIYALANNDPFAYLEAFGVRLESGVSLSMGRDGVLVIKPMKTKD